jgi:hypothetical protein
MHKPFEHLCSLIDEFWQPYEPPVKPGQKPRYHDHFYLKLYWFGICFACTTKSRMLARAEALLPGVFKKNLLPALSHDACRM